MIVCPQWPSPTAEQKEHMWTAAFKDFVLFLILFGGGCILGVTLCSADSEGKTPNYCIPPELFDIAATPPGAWGHAFFNSSAHSIALLAFAFFLANFQTIIFVADITVPPDPKLPIWQIISTPLGHAAFFTVQTLILQSASYWLYFVALLFQDSRILSVVYWMTLWVSAQGVMLTIMFFKLNWFEKRWQTEIRAEVEKKYSGFGLLMLFTHVPALLLGVFDLFLLRNGSIVIQYGPSFFPTLSVVCFIYCVLYSSFIKLVQRLLGVCIYPFVADLNTLPKLTIFVAIMWVAFNIFTGALWKLLLMFNAP